MKNFNKKIYFIYLAAFSNTGGIEEFAKQFIKSLENISTDNQLKKSKIEIISVYDNQSDYKTINQNVQFIGFGGSKIKTILYVIRKVKKEDIIFYSHINLLFLAAFNSLFKRVKKSYFSIYGIEVWKKFSVIKKYLLKNYFFLSISNYTKNIFVENSGVDPEKISIFPCCIDLNTSNKEYDNPYIDSEYNILSVSRLSKEDNYKGIDSVIKILPELKSYIPNIKYTIIGKGDDLNRLNKLSKNLNVEKNINFKGYVKNLRPYYKKCDIFTLPSKNEGFGIVYLEAMEYKKPVIAANSGGATDVIRDNETGFLCNYDDLESLKSKILFITNNKSKAKEIGKSGYNFLIENFTFKQFEKRLATIVYDLIKNEK